MFALDHGIKTVELYRSNGGLLKRVSVSEALIQSFTVAPGAYILKGVDNAGKITRKLAIF